jgi:RecB family endonuclease NucS
MPRRIRYSKIPKDIRDIVVHQEKMHAKSRQRSVNGQAIRIPPSNKLVKLSGNTWEFATETALEDFIWENLTALFDLTPLERQRPINGERCDIISVSRDNQLVILELKNSQDRGIVQQLTRYYANVINTKLFDVDYDKPVRLVAITPNFHKHNFIDREYSKLILEFIKFNIVVKRDSDLYLQLKNVDTKKTWETQIVHSLEQVHQIKDYLPPIPSVLTKMIESCSPEQKQIILQVRERILCFHERIQEIKGANFIKYGRGTTKMCVEIRRNSPELRSTGFNQPILFLYLPIPNRATPRTLSSKESNKLHRHPLGRMQILSSNTNKDWKTFSPELGVASYIPPGRRISASHSYTMNSFAPFITSKAGSDLDTLIDLALQSWLERL